MLKKIVLSAFALLFLLTANAFADTCLPKFNDHDFHAVTLFPNEVLCVYKGKQVNYWLQGEYEQVSGPWKVGRDDFLVCRDSAEDCVFKFKE